MYPNPVSDRLVVKTENVGATCEIVSVLGSQIYKKTLPSNHEFVDCSTWIPGVYFLQITNQSGSVQRTKFIVE
ncbi:MAG: T9SS type A sorting domain-containing protein [Flavobacteriales bacterium]|nr:T9SS type A sorting domain-containing protein [Flavobacteriales bacterium]